MFAILVILLILFRVGALPVWRHSRKWGYASSGGLGLASIRSFLAMGLVLTMLGLTNSTIGQTETAKTHSGIIRSINLKTRTLTVESSEAVVTFSVPTDAEIVVKDNPKGDLDHLMVGDKVEVKYTTDDTSFVAHRIAVLGVN